MAFLNDIIAIDVHGHYGDYLNDDLDQLVCKFMSATANEVVDRARNCNIKWTIVSPLSGLLPRGHPDCISANEKAFTDVQSIQGLLHYVIVNPWQPGTFNQARVMLKSPNCVGIKIHPEEHRYSIKEYGEILFSFFEEVNVPVMTHSGDFNSLPSDFLYFANNHNVKILLAHLGNGGGDRQRADLQVRAVQEAKHNNLWIDASSHCNFLPGLIEWAVSEIGAERIMFGSDTPLYHVALQRTRIDIANISARDKQLILYDNAIRFFNLSNL